MKISKRIPALFLSGALCVFAVAGCADKDSSSKEKDSSSQPPAETTTVPASTTAPNSEQTYTITPPLIGEPSADTESITPAFWKVSDESTGAVVYFLGSFHAATEDIYPLPEEITQAYEQSDALAVEADVVNLSLADQLTMVKAMMYTDGTTIKDHIGEDLYNQCVALLDEEGLYNSMYDSYNESMWAQLLQMVFLNRAGLDANQGIDMKFLQQATNDGKEIIELESVDFQTDLLNTAPSAYYQESFRYYTQSPEQALTDLQDTYALWKAGDYEALLESEDDTTDTGDLTDEEIQQIEDFNVQLVNDRNAGMAEKAVEMLQSGKKVFYIVGAAHYGGDAGILKLLENAGYTVEPVAYGSNATQKHAA